MPTAMLPLKRLNKQSCKIGSFPCRVIEPQTIEYEYVDKRSGRTVKGKRFHCILVGTEATEYVFAQIRGAPEAVINAAKGKYLSGTAWIMSGVSIDAKADAAYVSCPLKTVINLQNTKMAAVLKGQAPETDLPKDITPPLSVADAAEIRSKRSFDLIALIKDVGQTRTPPGRAAVADVLVVDGSKTKKGEVAEISISFWGEAAIAKARSSIGKPLLFVNLLADVQAPNKLKIRLSERGNVRSCTESVKARQLEEPTHAAELLSAETSVLTAVYEGGAAAIDPTGPALVLTAAILEAMMDNSKALAPDTLCQIPWARLEEPEIGAAVLTRDGERVFFEAVLRDFSGSTKVWVTEAAALKLSGATDKAAFQEFHEGRGVQFPMLCTVRVARRVRARTPSGATESTSSPDMESDVVTLQVVDACAVTWDPSHNVNMSHELIVKMLTSCPPSQDAMLTSLVTNIRASVHYGLEVEFTSKTRPAKMVLALVRSQVKSTLEETGTGHIIVTEPVYDALTDGKNLGK